MRRREFITAIFSVAATPLIMPRVACAQHAAKVGFLNGQSSDGWSEQIAAIRKGLGENGYVEGRNLATEFRFADNQLARLPALAADLVGRRVQVLIVSGGDEVAKAAVAASRSIPVVATFGGDPVENGLVASLNRPGGNLTGVSLFNFTLVEKQLELLHEALPNVDSVGVLVNPANLNSPRTTSAVRRAAQSRRLQLALFNASNAVEVDNAFAAATARKVGALIVVSDPLYTARRNQIVALAARYRLPAMYYQRMLVEAGGLIGYGSNRLDDYYRLGLQAGQVLGGANPGELPILQPTKFELVINLKTAKSLGLDLSGRILALADEVIE